MRRFMVDFPGSCTIFNLFCAHTLCMNYVTVITCLLVSSSVRSTHLYCIFCKVKAKKTGQKHTTKNFVEFHSIPPRLTMMLTKRPPALEVLSSSPSLTNAGFGIISDVVTRPATALDFQVTQVITNLLTAAIIKLTQIRQGACTRKEQHS